MTTQASSGLWPRICKKLVTFAASSPRLFIALHSSFVMLMFIPSLFPDLAQRFHNRAHAVVEVADDEATVEGRGGRGGDRQQGGGGEGFHGQPAPVVDVPSPPGPLMSYPPPPINTLQLPFILSPTA